MYSIDNYIKYLEMIQNVISRLAGNVDQANKWCLTLIAAMWAVLCKNDCAFWASLIATVILIVAFWILAAYYLTQERIYRELYNRIVGTDIESFDFSKNKMFDLVPKDSDRQKAGKTSENMLRPLFKIFYFPLLIINVIFAWFACHSFDLPSDSFYFYYKVKDFIIEIGGKI